MFSRKLVKATPGSNRWGSEYSGSYGIGVKRLRKFVKRKRTDMHCGGFWSSAITLPYEKMRWKFRIGKGL